MSKGHIFILSGPSGAGKGTICQKALASLDGIAYSVSCTSREPRSGDVNGRDYWFVTPDEFRALIDKGCFLEWANVHGNYYGTRKDIVEKALDGGTDILLEIDFQGAFNIKAQMPQAKLIFVMPPSVEELERRLRGRQTETDSQIELRMKNAAEEMSQSGKYDHVIVNDELERATNEFINIIKGYRRNSK